METSPRQALSVDKKDNRVENLLLCSIEEHAKIHSLRGSDIWLDCTCVFCKKEFQKRKKAVRPDQICFYCSKACMIQHYKIKNKGS
jgi:hypothetical protein